MTREKLSLATAMTIFGSIGIFRRLIPYPSGLIAFLRGGLGALVLFLWLLAKREPLPWDDLKHQAFKLFLSGAFLGFNWVFLFEAYRFTTIPVATMAYYMGPMIVMVLAPWVLGERLTKGQALCGALAVLGMALVSGIGETGISGAKGLGFGLLAGLFYAGLVLTNKTIAGLAGGERTLVQLAVAALVLLPYVLGQEDLTGLPVTPTIIVMVLMLGILHTGLAYALYFGSIGKLPAPTVALFAYLDPIVAVVLSVLILGDPLSPVMALGIGLVLGATFLAEHLGKTAPAKDAQDTGGKTI